MSHLNRLRGDSCIPPLYGNFYQSRSDSSLNPERTRIRVRNRASSTPLISHPTYQTSPMQPISPNRFSLPISNEQNNSQLEEMEEGRSGQELGEIDGEDDQRIENNSMQQNSSGSGWWDLAGKVTSSVRYLLSIPSKFWNRPFHTPYPSGNPFYQLNRGIYSFCDYAGSKFTGKKPPTESSLLSRLGQLRMTLDTEVEKMRRILLPRYQAERSEIQSQDLPRMASRALLPPTPAVNSSQTPQPSCPPDNQLGSLMRPTVSTILRSPSTSTFQTSTESAVGHILSPQAQEALDQWVEEERQVREKLIESTISFASFRFFNETIMGNKPENVMEYYNTIINSPNPKEFYCSQLSVIGQLLAKILIPIIEWILGLIFSYKETKLTGIANIAEHAKRYFSDPSVRTREFERAIEAGSDYFYKLHEILELFASGDGGTLTFQEYLSRKLEEDLENTGLTKEALYSNANAWFVEMINLQTEIPVIGPLVDWILKASLKPILDRTNIIQNAIHHGLGDIRPSSAFSYAVMDFIAKRLKEWTAALRNREEGQTEDTSAASTHPLEDPQIVFSERQQELLETFFERLIRYLPFEGVRMEEISRLLDREKEVEFSQLIHPSKLVKFVDKQIEKQIFESLKKIFIESIATIYQEFSKEEQQRSLWLNTLKLIQTIFTSNITRTDSECQQIQNEARYRLSEFLETALAHHFKNEFFATGDEKEKQKTHQLTTSTRNQIEASRNQLLQMHEALNRLIDFPNVDRIEDVLFLLSRELKELLSNLYNQLTTTYDPINHQTKIDISWKPKRGFLNGLVQAADQIEVINERSKQILQVTQTLRNYLQLRDATLEIMPREEEVEDSLLGDAPPSPDDVPTILSFNPSSEFHEWLASVSQVAQLLDEPDRGRLQNYHQSISSHVQCIESLNEGLSHRQSIREHLQNIIGIARELESIRTLNPEDCEEIANKTNAIQEILQTIDRLDQALYHSSTTREDAPHLQIQPILENLRNISIYSRASQLEDAVSQLTRATAAALNSHQIDADAETAEIEDHESQLHAQLVSKMQYLQERIDTHLNKIRAENHKFFEALIGIESAKDCIQDPESITLSLGAGTVADIKQAIVEPTLRRLANKILEIIINPKHYGEIIPRILLTRLMP